MKRVRWGSPISMKYCRAIFSAVSIPSDPPLKKIDAIDTVGSARDQSISELLNNVGCKKPAMRKCQAVDLRFDRLANIRIAVTESGNRRAA